MKRHLIVASVLALCVLFSAFSTTLKSVSLIDALEDPSVEAMLVSKGSSSLECVELNVVNHRASPISFTVVPGTRLSSGSNEYQDILITEPAEFVVQKGQSIAVPLSGFCCQSTQSSPEEGDLFASAQMASPELVKLANHVSDRGYGPSETQAAIWTLSDDHSLAGIYATQEDHELRDFCADIKGVESPWYNIDYGDILDRPFENVVQTLSGEMQYEIDNVARADLKVFGPNGELLITFYEDRQLTPAHYTQQFSFSGSSLDEGEYSFTLYLNGAVAQTEIVEI